MGHYPDITPPPKPRLSLISATPFALNVPASASAPAPGSRSIIASAHSVLATPCGGEDAPSPFGMGAERTTLTQPQLFNRALNCSQERATQGS
jgi:hypothetical protein